MTEILYVVQQFGEHFNLEKNIILLLAVHCMIKNRLVHIEVNSDELIGSYFEMSTRLTELKSYEIDDLEYFADNSYD